MQLVSTTNVEFYVTNNNNIPSFLGDFSLYLIYIGGAFSKATVTEPDQKSVIDYCTVSVNRLRAATTQFRVVGLYTSGTVQSISGIFVNNTEITISSSTAATSIVAVLARFMDAITNTVAGMQIVASNSSILLDSVTSTTDSVAALGISTKIALYLIKTIGVYDSNFV